MRILALCPLHLKDAVEAAVTGNMDLQGELKLNAKFSSDGGLTHTHWGCCTAVSEENIPVLNGLQQVPDFAEVEVVECALSGIDGIQTPSNALISLNLVRYESE